MVSKRYDVTHKQGTGRRLLFVIISRVSFSRPVSQKAFQMRRPYVIIVLELLPKGSLVGHDTRHKWEIKVFDPAANLPL